MRFLMLIFAAGLICLPVLAPAQEAALIAVTYQCERGVQLPVVYVNGDDSHAVALIEGRLLVLPQAISASGARYRADTDAPAYELWSKGNTAFLSWGTTQESKLLLADCVAAPTGDQG